MGLFDLDVVEVAIKNLKREGIRTFLTLIGIVIGIAAIVSLLSIGQGLSVAVQEQFQSLGSNTIFVIPGGMSSASSAIKLTDNDISQMEGVQGVSEVAPIYGKAAVLEYNNEKVNVSIEAIDASKASIFSNTGFLDVAEGRMLTKNDSGGMLIGDNISKTFFSRELHTRKIVLLDGQEFKVVGVLKPQGSSFGGGPSTGGSVYMSLEAFKRLTGDAVLVPAIIFVKTYTTDDVTNAAAQIKKNLEKKYGEKSVTVYTSEQLLEQINSFLSLITIFIAGVGGISLIVGGIGIMNAMITSVMERTREIGVMKALGASNNKILAIFLLEAAFIGAIGGIIGIGLGYLLATIIAIVGKAAGFALIAYFGPEIFVGALAFSMFVGMASGFFPALRAAKMDPVTALRYE